MQRTGFQLKTVLLAIALALGIPSVAPAQSSDGGISGDAAEGEAVTVQGTDTGFHGEFQIRKDGKYSLRRIPTSNYTVVVTDKDGNVNMSRTVRVMIGSTARVQ